MPDPWSPVPNRSARPLWCRQFALPWPMILSVVDGRQVALTGRAGVTIQSFRNAGDFRCRYVKVGRYVLGYVDQREGPVGR